MHIRFCLVNHASISLTRLCILLIVFFITTTSRGQEKSLRQSLGRQVYESIEKNQGFYQDEKLLSLITNIGGRLEEQLEAHEPFTYQIIDSDEPNAFATIGGYVFVTRGLLSMCRSQDELATVMGHEFAHVVRHHTEKSIYREILPKVIELPGNIIGGLLFEPLGKFINLPVELTSNTINSGFDRLQEKEADQLGIELAYKAGYDPTAFITIMNRLSKEMELLYGYQDKWHLFDDHPPTSERIQEIKKQLRNQSLNMEQSPPIYPFIDGLIVGENTQYGFLNESGVWYHSTMGYKMDLPGDWHIEKGRMSMTAHDTTTSSMIALAIDTVHYSVKEAASNFLSASKKDQKIEIYDVANIDINNFNSVEAVSINHGEDNELYTFSVWVQMNKTDSILQIIATTTDAGMITTLSDIINTIAPLTEKDKNQIEQNAIGVARGKEGETLNQFLDRVQNVGSKKLVSVMNDADLENQVDGLWVKYIKRLDR